MAVLQAAVEAAEADVESRVLNRSLELEAELQNLFFFTQQDF